MINIHELIQDMHSNKLAPKDYNIFNGDYSNQFLRYQVAGDKAGTKNGWVFIAHDLAVYNSWKNQTSQSYTFTTKDKKLTRKKIKLTINQAMRHCNKDLEVIQKENITKVKNNISYDTSQYFNFKYVQRKKCYNNTLPMHENAIAIPMQDLYCNIVGFQFIYQDGRKKFMKGSILSSSFFELQSLNTNLNLRPLILSSTKKQKAIICEGYATACSIAKQTKDYRIFICFSASNIKKVGKILCDTLQFNQVLIFADRDRNPNELHNDIGFKKAKECSDIYSNCETVSILEIGENQELDTWFDEYKVSDWNDIDCTFSEDNFIKYFDKRIQRVTL